MSAGQRSAGAADADTDDAHSPVASTAARGGEFCSSIVNPPTDSVQSADKLRQREAPDTGEVGKSGAYPNGSRGKTQVPKMYK